MSSLTAGVELLVANAGILGPYLLGDLSDADDEKPNVSWRKLPPHHDEQQAQLDVNRSFIYYPNSQSLK